MAFEEGDDFLIPRGIQTEYQRERLTRMGVMGWGWKVAEKGGWALTGTLFTGCHASIKNGAEGCVTPMRTPRKSGQ